MNRRALRALGLLAMAAGVLLIALSLSRPAAAPALPTSTMPSASVRVLPTARSNALATATRSAAPPPSVTQPPTAMPPVTPTPYLTATATGTTVPTATPFFEPLVPTRSETAPDAAVTPVILAEPSPSATTGWPTATPVPTTWRGHDRWGIGVAIPPLTAYDIGPLNLGWYLDWGTALEPASLPGREYVQMVRLRTGQLEPPAATIAAVARANPGSLWLIGNEPDVRWQDNVTPSDYARLYHEAYTTIKEADATALVAIGGIAQPTPLRLRYLDAILEAYREQFGRGMPVDIWNIHNFVLREERDGWGVGIPPGMTEQAGMLYEIEDSGDLYYFQRQIVAFRLWMASHGFRNKPLIVSEYGIPMPADYGFLPERVARFMTGTFDYFRTATDPQLGDPNDGYRLVQMWCWFSLNDLNYPTGNLFDPDTKQMTPLGQAWADYVADK